MPDMQRATVSWPNGELMACTFRIAYSGFHGNSYFKRDPNIPVNQASLSHADYAGRVGIWRLMELFDKFDISTSVNLNTVALEKWPKSVEALHAAGHDIGAHGTTHDKKMTDRNEEEERAEIRTATKLIEDAIGVRPVGWGSVSNMCTENTVRILAEEGYRYFADSYCDDVPYVVSVQGHRMAFIPRLIYANDMRGRTRYGGNGEDYARPFLEAFDYLYEEALAGRPGYIDVGAHVELTGRPHMASGLKKMIQYVKQFGSRVWIANRRDIADYLLDQAADVEVPEYEPYR